MSARPPILWTALIVGLVALWTPAWLNALWGLNLWAQWSLGIRLTATALLAVAVLARRHGDERVPARPEGGRRLLVATALALGLVWLLFPARTVLFGDAGELVGRFAPGVTPAPRSPFYSQALDLLRRLFQITSVPGMHRMMSAFSLAWGLLWLATLAVLFGRRRLSPELTVASCFLGGGLSLFQGYIETYAPFAVLLLVYTALADEPPDARRSAGLVVAQVALIGAHLVGVLLLPVTILLGLKAVPPRRRAILVLSGLAAMTLVSGLLAAFGAVTPLAGLDWDVGRRFLCARALAWRTGPSPALDALDVTNNLLLTAAPALLGLLILVRDRTGRAVAARVARSAPGWIALLFLLARYGLATGLGAFLDWDFGAIFAIPLQFAVARAWSAPELAGLRRRQAVALPFVAFLLAAPQWAVLNDAPRATARVVAYRDGRPAPPAPTRAQLDHRLGDELARAGREAEAGAAFDRAFAADPRGLYARRAATAWLHAGQRSRALAGFTRAIRTDSADVVALEQRGFLNRELGDPRLARRDFLAVLRLQPDRANALLGLGAVGIAEGDTAGARTLLRRAAALYRAELERGTGHAQTRRLLKQCLELLGER